MKCSNVVECALLVCVLCQPVPPSIHRGPIPTFGSMISFRNLYETCIAQEVGHKNNRIRDHGYTVVGAFDLSATWATNIYNIIL